MWWILGAIIIMVSILIGVGFFLKKENLPQRTADAALVFGTGLAWKAKARYSHAAKLFQQGIVRNIIVSGGVSVKRVGLTEAAWFKEELLGLGVPAERIFLEYRATNAAENVEFALPILKQQRFTSIVLVMSDFTGIRAHLTAKRALLGCEIEIYNSHAPSSGHWNPWSWWLTKEGWQLTKYVVVRLFRYKLLPYLWKDL